MKIVVLGAGGRLGAALMREFRPKYEVVGFNHAQLDLSNLEGLREKVGAAPTEDGITVSRGDDPRLLARDGLVGLGFSVQEAVEMLEAAPSEARTPEDLIAHALKGART